MGGSGFPQNPAAEDTLMRFFVKKTAPHLIEPLRGQEICFKV
jgi:hypothetical protein